MSTDSKARHQVSSYGPPSSALMEESYDYGDSNFQRPRRPNPDTLSYIKVLPLSFQVAQTELKDYEHQVNNNNSNEYVDEESTSNNKFLSDEDKEEMIQSLLPTRIAAQSAIEEVQNEIASLAGDESGSAMMETLARIVSLSSSPSSSTKTNNASIAPDTESIRKMMQGLQGYHLHLASHRYGSHVVQTILQSAAKCLKAYDDPDYSNGTVNPNDSDETPLYELIQSAVNELIPHTKELAVHICGSHVIRTMLHVLAGAEVEERGGPASPVDKRGKQKKKKKKQSSKNMTQGPMNAGRNISLPLLKSHRYKNKHVAESFKKCLTQFVSAFIEGDSEETSTDEKIKMGYELQTLVCHPSAGPLLSILLRVLCIMEANDASDMNSNNNDSGSVDRDFRLLGILPCEAQYQPGSTADELVKAVLCWELDKSKSGEEKEEKDPNTSVNCGDIIYGLSGEPTGSIFLETILRTCASTDFYSEFCQRAGFFSADGIRDYTIHSVSNFVIQTLLATCRTKEQAESLCKGLFPCFNSSQKNEKKSDTKETENDDTLLPLLLQKRRRGVLWRLTELCAKWKVGQETLLNSIRTGFVSESEKSEEENKADVNDDSNNKSSKGRKRKKKAQSLPMDECVRKLLDFNVSSTIEGRISLDVNGARTIYHMLHFVPRLCSDILDTLVNKLSTEEIEKISMDGLGSRCIMDAILSNPSMSTSPFPSMISDLLVKLSGRWTSLSVDRVGHHTVKKLFNALSSMDLKLNLVQELSEGGMNRLNGNSMGRAVLEECFVNDFMRGGEYTWRDVVTKKMKQKEWLSELGNEDGDEDDKKKKKRRKRKRKADENTNSEKVNENEGNHEKVVEKSSVVTSIMDAISIPSTSKESKKEDSKENEEKSSKKKRKRKKKN